MIVGVQGTSGFNDYNVFLRAMGVTEENPIVTLTDKAFDEELIKSLDEDLLHTLNEAKRTLLR